MRVSHTSLAVAALLFLAACGTSSPEIVAPEATPRLGSGTWIGSGNYIAPDSVSTQGASVGGSTTGVPTDPTRSGTWIGSGN